MKNSLCLSVLAMTCLGLAAANGQAPNSYSPDSPNGPALGTADPGPTNPGPPGNAPLTPAPGPVPSRPTAASPGGLVNQSKLNDYLVYLRPTGCCSVLGRDGSIGSEAYVRYGTSFNTGSGIFGRVLAPGFTVEGGVRSIFFDPGADSAWTVDVGVSSVWFHARKRETANLQNFASTTTIFGQNVTTNIPNFPVTPRDLNQTYVNLAIGREYYLMGESDPLDGNLKWRAGWDGGGRIGASKLDLEEIKHRNGFVYGSLAAVHTDLEIPYGMAIFQTGIRFEHSYIASHILQRQNNTDLSMFNILLTTGVRY